MQVNSRYHNYSRQNNPSFGMAVDVSKATLEGFPRLLEELPKLREESEGYLYRIRWQKGAPLSLPSWGKTTYPDTLYFTVTNKLKITMNPKSWFKALHNFTFGPSFNKTLEIDNGTCHTLFCNKYAAGDSLRVLQEGKAALKKENKIAAEAANKS